MKFDKILGTLKINEDKLYEMAVPILAQKLKDPNFAALMNKNPDAAAAQLQPIVMTATDRTPLDFDRVVAILKAKFGIQVKSPAAISVIQKATAPKPTPTAQAPAQPVQPTGAMTV
jgi:hypothetical protein